MRLIDTDRLRWSSPGSGSDCRRDRCLPEGWKIRPDRVVSVLAETRVMIDCFRFLGHHGSGRVQFGYWRSAGAGWDAGGGLEIPGG